MNKIIDSLKERKILNDITNLEKFNSLPKGCGVYIGFDPTAKSLHLGNYVQIAILKMFQNAGFEAFALVGGATGMIGDPSGKSQERNLLENAELNENKKAIEKQLKGFGLKVVDNLDFYKKMNVLDFLRDAGKLLNVNYMINKEVVKSRLETGISFTEFSYQLIQGWDFKTLYDKHNVCIEVGGSDQWGNITAGIEMIRKTSGEKNNAVGITTKLLTTASGVKFGKSAGNALFLDPESTSPFEMYQYLFNTTDEDVEKLLMWLTPHTVSKISQIMQMHDADKKVRKAQKELSYQVVMDIHGKDIADRCLATTDVLFGKVDVRTLTTEQVLGLDVAVPVSSMSNEKLIDVLVEVKAAQSKREAREFLVAGAIEVNGEKISDENYNVAPSDFNKKATIIKRGKRKFFLIKH